MPKPKREHTNRRSIYVLMKNARVVFLGRVVIRVRLPKPERLSPDKRKCCNLRSWGRHFARTCISTSKFELLFCERIGCRTIANIMQVCIKQPSSCSWLSPTKDGDVGNCPASVIQIDDCILRHLTPTRVSAHHLL